MVEPWLSIVGIGENGVAGLTDEARALIENARHVFGGARHLDLVQDLTPAQRHPWPTPFSQGIAQIEGLRGQPVCVLASGDPFWFGVGASLARTIAPADMAVVPAPSSFSLAAARLGWPLHEVETLSVHGRPLGLLRRHLHPGRKLLVLTSDQDGPRAIAEVLVALGFNDATLSVLEALGGPDERIRAQHAGQFSLTDVAPLNIVAIAMGDAPGSALPFTPGLPDDLFSHDGQITKAEIRATTLSALAPRHGEHLWDIGAGSGSVGIEWMLMHPSLRATAIEKNAARLARIKDNAQALGAPALALVDGAAPAALAGLQPPDSVFLGGGGSEPGVLETAMAALKPGGRLVANAVTLETEAVLLAAHAEHGGALTRLEVSRAAPVGTLRGWRPAMPVIQWVWHKERV